jgi:hypothetical protein
LSARFAVNCTSSLISRRSSFSIWRIRSLTSTIRGCSICRPAECQQLARQGGSALAGRTDFFEVVPDGSVSGDFVEDQVGVAEDRGQQIVEVVSDASGQLTDRLHFLRVAQLFLEAPPFGNVPGVDHDRLDRRIGEAVDADPFERSPLLSGIAQADLRGPLLARPLLVPRRICWSPDPCHRDGMNSKIVFPIVVSGSHPSARVAAGEMY